MAQEIPSNIRVPFVYVTFDPSKATSGPSILKYKALMIGQKLSTGVKEELQVSVVSSSDEMNKYFGIGSQLGRMGAKWFANNKSTELKAVAIGDEVGAVAATGTITIGGTATSSGAVAYLINGVLISVNVAIGDVFPAVASAVNNAINADTSLPVTSSITTPGQIDLVAKNAGESGNDIDVRQNYYDADVTPSGLTSVIVGMASGATNPDITEIVDILGDEWFNIIVNPWTDTVNLTALENELTDRFGPIRMIDSVAFISKRGTLGELSTFGNSRNSPHISCMNSHKIPNTPEEMISAVAGQIAASAENDPARPFQTLPLVGILPPAIVERFTWAENNTLLYDGISTYQVDDASVVRIQRAITMYQKNDAGASDTAYLDVNTMLTLMFMRYDLRNTILSRYPRAKLASDDVRTPSGQQIMTPKVGKSEVINIATKWQNDLAIMEGLEAFKENLIVERDAADVNRLNILLRPALVNQLRVVGATVQFLL